MTNKKPKGYWKIYEQSRKAETYVFDKGTRKLRNKICKIVYEQLAVDTNIEYSSTVLKYVTSCVMVLVCKERHRLSYRGLASAIASLSKLRRTCGLTYCPSKSTLHAMANRVATLGKEFMDRIVAAVAAISGHSTRILHGDSTGFGLRMYVDWNNAKYGQLSVHDFVKLHLITAARGPILTYEVTNAHAHDSPEFAKMIRRIPNGGPGMVALDAAYDSADNCQAITDGGRVPVIMPRSNAVARGFSPRAKMIRWYQERPDDFMKSYGIRSLAESVFSSMKERTGTHVRARSLATQKAELFARILCYNLSLV